MKKSLFYLCALGFVATISSCEGIFDSIYDKQPDRTSESENIYGFRDVVDNKATLYLDCTKYDEWIYINLDTKTFEAMKIPTSKTNNSVSDCGIAYQQVEFFPESFSLQQFIETDPQPEPENWHFAIHHFDVRTNDGFVAETNYNSLDDLPKLSELLMDPSLHFVADEVSDNQCIVDREKMLSYYIGYQKIKVNRILSKWAVMDFSIPPPTYHKSDKVFIIGFNNGKYCAIHLDDYADNSNSKGYMTISYIYPY